VLLCVDGHVQVPEDRTAGKKKVGLGCKFKRSSPPPLFKNGGNECRCRRDMVAANG
jgi:hypothetical protein